MFTGIVFVDVSKAHPAPCSECCLNGHFCQLQYLVFEEAVDPHYPVHELVLEHSMTNDNSTSGGEHYQSSMLLLLLECHTVRIAIGATRGQGVLTQLDPYMLSHVP